MTSLTLNTYTDASQEFKRREISLLDRHDKSRVVYEFVFYDKTYDKQALFIVVFRILS